MLSFFNSVLDFFKTILDFLNMIIDSIGTLFKMIPLTSAFIGSAVAYMPTFIGAFLLLSLSVLIIKLIVEAL